MLWGPRPRALARARRADRGEKRVVVVCHWGVISALTDVDANNCDVVGLLFSPHAEDPTAPAKEERRNCYKSAVKDLGWTYDVLGPWNATSPKIPCLETTAAPPRAPSDGP